MRGRGRGIIPGLLGTPTAEGLALPAGDDAIRLTQYAVEVLSSLTPVIELPDPPTGGGTVGTGTNPDVGASLCGAEVPLAFLTWGTYARASSEISDLNPDYYYGRKPGGVLSFGTVERALSDPISREFETATARVIIEDTGRDLRERIRTLGSFNHLLDIYMYSDVGRRIEVDPLRIFQGVIRGDSENADLSVTLNCEDWFGSQFCQFDKEKLTPDYISPIYFPNAPIDYFGLPEQLIYGKATDELELSGTGAPVLTGTPSRGSFVAGGQRMVGFGDLPSLAAIPTSPALVAAAGGTVSANVGAGASLAKYGLVVTAVDVNGVESDPVPFYTDQVGSDFAAGVPTATVSGSQKLQASWVASAGAVKYRAYLLYYYFGARCPQWIETTATSCEFTASPDGAPGDQTAPLLSEITPGANLNAWNVLGWYAVSANMSDGETAKSEEAITIQRISRRESRLEWLAVTGAESYTVYKRLLPTGNFVYKWTVPATQTFFDDDWVSTGTVITNQVPVGVVQTRYMGQYTLLDGFPWEGFLVCRGAIAQIVSWFASDLQSPPTRIKMEQGTEGVDFLIPGRTGWNAIVGPDPFIDVGDRRYTMIFARGPFAQAAIDRTIPICVNCYGYEDVGDSTGNFIETVPRQYLHFLTNFVVQKTQKFWQPIPLNAQGYSIIRGTSFEAAHTYYGTKLSGGLKGAWVLGAEEFEQVGTTVAKLNKSCDGDIFINSDGQLELSALDTAAAITDTVVDVPDVLAGSLQIWTEPAEFFTEIQYWYQKVYTESPTKETPLAPALLPRELADKTVWGSGLVGVFDPTAVGVHGENRAYPLELWMIRDQKSADLIANSSGLK
jgi:hypothetical protein